MTHRIRPAARLGRIMGWVALTAMAGGAVAQTVTDQSTPETALDIPANLQIFGKVDPNVRKPTAIVNDFVITGTDVDQRLALIIMRNGGKAPPTEQLEQLKLEILRQLIDETLEIQEAKSADITVTQAEIEQAMNGLAKQMGRSVSQLRGDLRAAGSSERSARRAIEGELAWTRYLRRKVEPFVNVGDEEVKAIIDRLQASKGAEEYHLQEIYLSANDANREQIAANARQIIGELQKGQQPFEFYARSYSEASTKAVGGDLGWLRLATLPQPLAEAAQQMQVGQVAGPIATPGGFSILYLLDKRTVGAADPRDARLSLKQLTIHFPANTTMAQAQARAGTFAQALKQIQGCGSVEKVAASVGAEVVDNDSVPVRSVPDPRLQQILLGLQVGQATPPFGSPQDGVRSLVLCGRDDPQQSNLPSANQIQGQLEQQRVNLRAQSKLRDLRRDAVIEYR
ncbi:MULTISPECIES: peptidylprolyl isomerase [Sphingomonas]|uniref:peptidylprolyl isomerase n=1 Tax=Sphingomonas TaxID=13687 RepID=UPI00280A64ED|nr:peptidylprolyl isomerase [Sphingomonas sp. GV3]